MELLMTSFIFDLDGTLTDARQKIDKKFKDYMYEFVNKYSCYICTGSDYPKVEEQLGKDLTKKFAGIFLCSGNHCFVNGIETYKSKWQINNEEEQYLIDELEKLNYPYKTGNHIEKRIGTVNVSIPGRNATVEDRKIFIPWDTAHQARSRLAEKVNQKFTRLSAVIGGETGVDIFEKGKDKSQILEGFNKNLSIHFFGDKMHPGGNDFALGVAVGALPNGKVYSVKNWQHTYEILKDPNFIP
jgi:phosphomannomutase